MRLGDLSPRFSYGGLQYSHKCETPNRTVETYLTNVSAIWIRHHGSSIEGRCIVLPCTNI